SRFAGAGLSVPLGLPSWVGLVNALLRNAGLAAISDNSKEPELQWAATGAKPALRRRHNVVLGEFLDVRHHALGHALVASTRARQNVTTNFDKALELAMATTHGNDLKVLTSQWAGENAPWLLKLHGTAGDADGIILTEDDFRRHREKD